jgi:L-ascorbate metabolism protein UlaG (beta-lactamase superfamily)
MTALKAIASLLVLLLASSIWAKTSAKTKTVSITPLGARTGEFCQVDRALLFQDPSGVRILYDPGRTVAGSKDPRLGDVHVVLLTHVHGDHLGDVKLAQDPDESTSSCAGDLITSPALPHSNTAEIATGKNSAVIVSADVSTFLGSKIADLRGVPTPSCAPGNEIVVPRSQPCTSNVGFGAKRIATLQSGTPGVRITAVHAEHGNGLDPAFVHEPEKTYLASNGLLAPMGPALGYVLTFSNGLTVYLTGDTGHMSDMATIVRDYYGPKLVVFNIGDIFTTGPDEAAFAVTHLIDPRAVIPEHANEVATRGGVVIPGTKTARFLELLGDTPGYLPLSGRMMEFDGDANCVAGCGAGKGRKHRPRQ